jgi:gamma-glutamylaminecyclotransferase
MNLPSSAPPASHTFVFVYGTLKRGGTNHHVLAHQTFVADARTPPGYRMFVVADYPGMVRDRTDQRGVAGEIWSVDAPTLLALDDLEGVAEKLYRRDPIPLLPPHDQLPVQGYIYLRNTRGRRPLVDGIWPIARRS